MGLPWPGRGEWPGMRSREAAERQPRFFCPNPHFWPSPLASQIIVLGMRVVTTRAPDWIHVGRPARLAHRRNPDTASGRVQRPRSDDDIPPSRCPMDVIPMAESVVLRLPHLRPSFSLPRAEATLRVFVHLCPNPPSPAEPAGAAGGISSRQIDPHPPPAQSYSLLQCTPTSS